MDVALDGAFGPCVVSTRQVTGNQDAMLTDVAGKRNKSKSIDERKGHGGYGDTAGETNERIEDDRMAEGSFKRGEGRAHFCPAWRFNQLMSALTLLPRPITGDSSAYSGIGRLERVLPENGGSGGW